MTKVDAHSWLLEPQIFMRNSDLTCGLSQKTGVVVLTIGHVRRTNAAVHQVDPDSHAHVCKCPD